MSNYKFKAGILLRIIYFQMIHSIRKRSQVHRNHTTIDQIGKMIVFNHLAQCSNYPYIKLLVHITVKQHAEQSIAWIRIDTYRICKNKVTLLTVIDRDIHIRSSGAAVGIGHCITECLYTSTCSYSRERIACDPSA